jgi:chromosome partitioning protein
MARIIAVCNNKGGVGKTNLSCNLPVFLAAAGKKVLLVDFDHQANATYSLGLHPKNIPLSVYHAILGNVTPRAIIRRTQFFGYDLMPSTQDLAGAEVELVSLRDRELKLSQLLQKIQEDYDFIFIDSPPSLGVLTINALAAAHEVLVPVQCEYLALEGLSQLLSTIELVRKNLGHNLQIGGAVLTMYNPHHKISREVANEIRQNFPGYVFRTVIPRAVAFAEAPKVGKTIFHYAPTSRAAQAYQQLAQEFLLVQQVRNPQSHDAHTASDMVQSEQRPEAKSLSHNGSTIWERT